MARADMDYFIPGTKTLDNKLGEKTFGYGIKDPGELAAKEVQLSAVRMQELQEKPIAGDFGYAHMQQIHEHLFQDVYAWAGQPRTVDLNRDWPHDSQAYGPHQDIETLSTRQQKLMGRDSMLKGITDPNEFADTLAFHWGEINMAHAFRDGNLRAQAVFFEQLANEAGWDLDISRLDADHPDSVRDAFLADQFSYRDDNYNTARLTKTLSKLVTIQQPELTADVTRERDLTTAARADVPSNPKKNAVPKETIAERMRRFPELAPDSNATNHEPDGPIRFSADGSSMQLEL